MSLETRLLLTAFMLLGASTLLRGAAWGALGGRRAPVEAAPPPPEFDALLRPCLLFTTTPAVARC